ncbi:hypothetical protein BJ322DRAFT_1103054 [Thelephora terrestris]|uniref:Uncharacterized protein n=1 Tax=Thelephora terrestris TaxID=56493 RepID=A0A9P6HQS2_9AGAM|nr:hypothetical protein BJ322DRAFT_1103054 [Thelephora terrestris]
MTIALAELPVSALADVCVKGPQTSTRPLLPSEYYPPGTSRTSTVRTGADADRIYNATVGQRNHILQQLEEAERNARDALFALERMEMELARETAAIKSTLSDLSETLPAQEFEKMCDFAFGQSKKDWENVWKHEWVEDGTERSKFITRCSGSSRTPRPNPPPPPQPHSSPLPPSSPPPPSSPNNPQTRFPPRPSPVRTSGAPADEPQPSTHPHSPPTLDGFRTPWGFIDSFGSTSYRPKAPEPVASPPRPHRPRRLKRDDRRLAGTDRNGMPIIVDPSEHIASLRREVKEMIRLQAHMKYPVEAENALLRIVQRTEDYENSFRRDPPVTWSRLYEDKEPHPSDLTNPFARVDHVPPAYPEVDLRDEHEPESDADPHVRDDQP